MSLPKQFHAARSRARSSAVLPIVAALLLSTAAGAPAQPERPHPLAGVNSLSGEGTLGLVRSEYSEGAFRPADSSIRLGRLAGEVTSVGLIFSRSMPDFFISRGMTVRAGVEYIRLAQESSGTGRIVPDGDSSPVEVTQRTTVESEIIAATVGIRINTSRGSGRLMPTVDLGATFGHVLDLEFRTETEPEGVVPPLGFEPDRRFYYNTVNLGLGLGIALGRPGVSATIIPSLSLRAATTSLTKNEGEEIVPLSLAAGLEFRFPLATP